MSPLLPHRASHGPLPDSAISPAATATDGAPPTEVSTWAMQVSWAELACAAKAGTVIAVNNSCSHNYAKNSSCGCGGGYGNYVIISHDGTYSTLYGHLSSAAVSVGQYVEQGQVIGYIGSTGWSTGAHLHFEVRVNGVANDPLGYVSP